MAGKVFRQRRNAAVVSFEVEKDNGELITFNCNAVVPGGIILAFSDLTGTGGDSDSMEERVKAGRGAVKIVRDLFTAAVVKAQQGKFWGMVNGTDPDGVIDVEMMMEIADHLAEAYAARPTGADSSAGSPTTSNGSSSTDGASPTPSTYSRSTPAGSST